MVYALSYRRPAHVDSSRASIRTEKSDKSADSDTAGSVTSSNSCPYGIPEALSFDKIINGGTCPPVTTREFMDFLQYIEHTAENLQFYLWYRDYTKRFNALPESERSLAPEWTTEQADAEYVAMQKEKMPKKLSIDPNELLKGTEFDTSAKIVMPEAGANPFNTPPRTPSAADLENRAPSTVGWSEDGSTIRSGAANHAKKSAAAFDEAKTHQPFTIQPYREEISRIIAIYIAENGQRELNLSARERGAVLKALSYTTHPSAFRDVIATVQWSLRHQAHPNFIRWTICNGNPPRQRFAQGLGIGGIVAGIVFAIVITLSSANRGWRALAAVGLIVGIATLFAGWKGMCVVLHGMHHRHLRPWELFISEDDASSCFDLKKGSFDSLGSNNSFEDEPWVAKYEKRNIIRKIFDREVWIQEPALRQIQDTIFLQAVLTAVLISAVVVAVFVAVPKGNFF